MNNEYWRDVRPLIASDDLHMVHGLADTCPNAERLLITGEATKENLGGDIGVQALVRWGLTLGTTVCMPTGRGTLRMIRFQNSRFAAENMRSVIWDAVPEPRRSKLFQTEAERMGVKYWTQDTFEFYSGIIEANKLAGKYIRHEDKRIQNYVNACLLFEKPGLYFDPPETIFSAFTFTGVELLELSKAEKKQFNMARRPDVPYVTMQELGFLSVL